MGIGFLKFTNNPDKVPDMEYAIDKPYKDQKAVDWSIRMRLSKI